MCFRDLYQYLNDNGIEYEIDAKIASYVSLRVGGIADVMIFPDTIEKFCNLVTYVHGRFKCYILGNGTNCYFGEYYNGVIISTVKLNGIKVQDNQIIAECGASLTRCAVYACDNGLTGFEFLFGIPGSIGGGVYMNASAYGSMVSDYVKECTVYDINKKAIVTLNKNDLLFDVKKSIFMERDLFALNVKFQLSYGNREEIHCKMNQYMKKRIESQPLDLPNAGSTFKRPKNAYASKLIDEAGLKGYRIGDAEVSTKHAGFIVNKGSATSNDINMLINKIKVEIREKFSIELEEEIIFVE